jgi:hypothetical protein
MERATERVIVMRTGTAVRMGRGETGSTETPQRKRRILLLLEIGGVLRVTPAAEATVTAVTWR